MDAIDMKTMQDIKDYVRSLNTPENEIYQNNSLLIQSCFFKALEILEKNAQSRQAAVSGSLPPSTVVIEQTENFIHLRTDHVPEWVHKLEDLNQKIISELRGGNATAKR